MMDVPRMRWALGFGWILDCLLFAHLALCVERSTVAAKTARGCREVPMTRAPRPPGKSEDAPRAKNSQGHTTPDVIAGESGPKDEDYDFCSFSSAFFVIS